MSRSSRRAHNSVSLFPFLAVLVCVMGGLILLLVVNTRHMRMQGRAEAVAQQRAAAPPELIDEIPADEPAVASDVVLPPAPQLSEEEDDLAESPSLKPPPHEEDHAANEAIVAEKWQQIAELQRKLGELDAMRQEREAARAKLETLLEKTGERLAVGASAVGELDQSLEQTQGERAKLARETLIVSSEYDRLLRHMEQLRRELEYAKQQQADVANRYAFVPYNGKKGTSRRPILIECTEQYIRFLPEDIRLTPYDLNGFTPGINPLLTGTQTLSAYWRAWHRMHPEPGVEDEPYVMLIVRPSGSVAYYIARKLLGGLQQPYGYELVSADWELDLAEADPRAKRECQAAIDDLLKQRDRIREELRSQPFLEEEPLTLDQPRNRFDIEDVEKAAPRRRSGAGSSFDPDGPVSVKPTISSPRADSEYNGDVPPSRQPLALEQPPARFPTSSDDRELTNAPNSDLSAVPPEPGTPRSIADDERDELTPFDRMVEFPSLDDAHPDLADQPNRYGDEYSMNRLKTDHIVNSNNDLDAKLRDHPDVAGSDYNFGDEVPTQNGDKKTFGPPPPHDPAEKGSAGRKASAKGNDKKGTAEQGTNGSATADRQYDGASSPFGDSSRNSAGGDSQNSGSDSSQGRGSSSPLIMDLGKPRSRRGEKIDARRWGSPSPDATIGFERELRIQIQDDRTIVGQIQIPTQSTSMTRKEFEESVVVAIDREVRSWTQPPSGFYWVPKVHFHVGKGGGGRYEHLHNELRDLGLSTVATHTSDERAPQRSEPASLRSGQSSPPAGGRR